MIQASKELSVEDEKMMKTPPLLSVVVPCYYEEEVLPSTAEVLGKLLQDMIGNGEISPESHICFVNDGSQDNTWPIIENLASSSALYCGVNLSRNFGHQSAVLAGLFTDTADAYVTIDADLQDDATKIRDMVALYREGKDIVYGCRNDRTSDTWFKRTTAEAFYSLRKKLGCYTVPNHADYRLMSLRAVHELRKFGEVNLYLRGIVPLLGFPSAQVFYARAQREKGESKYPLSKMIKLACDGVMNFSDVPLHLCLWAGCMGILFSMGLVVYSLVRWHAGYTLPGWTSTVLIISCFMSMQFLFTGIIGLYIGKIFRETKSRPRYIVQEYLSNRHQP